MAEEELTVFDREARSNASKGEGTPNSSASTARKSLAARMLGLGGGGKRDAKSNGSAGGGGDDNESVGSNASPKSTSSVRKTITSLKSKLAAVASGAPAKEPEPDLSAMTPEEREEYRVRKMQEELARLKREAAMVEAERQRLEQEVSHLTEQHLREKDNGGYMADGGDSYQTVAANPFFRG